MSIDARILASDSLRAFRPFQRPCCLDDLYRKGPEIEVAESAEGLVPPASPDGIDLEPRAIDHHTVVHRSPSETRSFRPITKIRAGDETAFTPGTPGPRGFSMVLHVRPPLMAGSGNSRLIMLQSVVDVIVTQSLKAPEIHIQAVHDVVLRNVTLKARHITISGANVILEGEVKVFCTTFKMQAPGHRPPVEANDIGRWNVSEDAGAGTLEAIVKGVIPSSRK